MGPSGPRKVPDDPGLAPRPLPPRCPRIYTLYEARYIHHVQVHHIHQTDSTFITDFEHKIFQENPDSVVSTEFGDFRAPFHCYAAQSYTMMGMVSLDGARDRLSQEGLYPFQFRMPNGDVGAGAQVSFIDYSDTNYGPYRELVFSLFTTV